MRQAVKMLLCRMGLWYPLVHLRQAGAVVTWLEAGCPKLPPSVIKLWVVRSYCKQFGMRVFVETGTHLGETTEWVARLGLEVISVELSDECYHRAWARLRRYRNVRLIHGDSADVLPDLLMHLNEPACFWLDAHYAGKGTAREIPIVSELKAILRHPVHDHVILIDDAHFFTGSNGYPVLDELLAEVRATGVYQAEVSADIIRITPQGRG